MSKSKDPLDKASRSLQMARVRSQDTKPEILFRSLLHRKGFRFRKNVKDLPGKPDVVLPKYKTVIFIHGCFWHRHNCKRGQRRPTNNQAYWEAKFQKNVQRDKHNQDMLRQQGWRVITIWECELKSPANTLSSVVNQISAYQ